jgi:hypothetical protein
LNLYLNNKKQRKLILRKKAKTTRQTTISSIQKFKKNKETIQKKIYKNMGLPNKTINRSEENIIQGMVSFKEARDKIEYKRNAALDKTEVRSRHRVSWDEFVTH